MFKSLAAPCFAALLLCACGGGKANEAFKPDMSTPTGAFEAYKRSIEDLDEKIAAEVFAGDSEYDDRMDGFRKNVSQSQIKGKRFVVNADGSTQLGDDLAIVRVTPTELDGEGKETTVGVTQWIAFVKRKDGTWRYDSKATVAIRNKKAAEEKAAAASNAPAAGNAPAPSNAAATGNAPKANGG